MLPGLPVYPFKSGGKYMLLVIAVFYGLAELIAAVIPVLGSFINLGMSLLFSVAICGYISKVISSSAVGEDSPPDWPSDMISSSLLMVAAFILCIFPAFALKWLVDSTWYMPALLAGLAILPMAMLSVSLHENLWGLSPVKIIWSIIKIFPAYILVLALLFVMLVIYVVATSYIPHVLAISRGLVVAMLLYLIMVQMKLVGSIYYVFSRRLGWFE